MLHLNQTRLMGMWLEPLPKFPAVDCRNIATQGKNRRANVRRIIEDDFPVVDFPEYEKTPTRELLWPCDTVICLRFYENYDDEFKDLYL